MRLKINLTNKRPAVFCQASASQLAETQILQKKSDICMNLIIRHATYWWAEYLLASCDLDFYSTHLLSKFAIPKKLDWGLRTPSFNLACWMTPPGTNDLRSHFCSHFAKGKHHSLRRSATTTRTRPSMPATTHAPRFKNKTFPSTLVENGIAGLFAPLENIALDQPRLATQASGSDITQRSLKIIQPSLRIAAENGRLRKVTRPSENGQRKS